MGRGTGVVAVTRREDEVKITTGIQIQGFTNNRKRHYKQA